MVFTKVINPVLRGVVQAGILPWTRGLGEEPPPEGWDSLVASPFALGRQLLEGEVRCEDTIDAQEEKIAELEQKNEQIREASDRQRRAQKQALTEKDAVVKSAKAAAEQARFECQNMEQRLKELTDKNQALLKQCVEVSVIAVVVFAEC